MVGAVVLLPRRLPDNRPAGGKNNARRSTRGAPRRRISPHGPFYEPEYRPRHRRLVNDRLGRPEYDSRIEEFDMTRSLRRVFLPALLLAGVATALPAAAETATAPTQLENPAPARRLTQAVPVRRPREHVAMAHVVTLPPPTEARCSSLTCARFILVGIGF
jgi:hypothetical protein